MSTKPREFWIEVWKEKPLGPLIEHRPVAMKPFEACTEADELIHVIEKSAYDEVVEALRSAYGFLKHADRVGKTEALVREVLEKHGVKL